MNRMIVLVAALCLPLAACAPEGEEPAGGAREVIIYTALDQTFAEPILDDFEQETGIDVKAVFDTEAVKTVGLVNRIINERNNPRCDVFWNNEIMHTIRLKQEGLLAPYASPSAAEIPAAFKDPDHMWTGFAARARVIIYNTDKIQNPADAPDSLDDFLDPQYLGRMTVAKPLFGTTFTHAAAMFADWGPEASKDWWLGLKGNKVLISPGNAQVRDRVASGEMVFGLTDTDDAAGAILDGKPVAMLYPDQDGEGTLVIPNTIALIKDGPNPEAAKQLMDYILSPEVEGRLAQSRSQQMPLRDGIPEGELVPPVSQIKAMRADWEEVAAQAEPAQQFLEAEFLQ